MNKLIHTGIYRLPGDPLDLDSKVATNKENTIKAVAHWKSVVDENLVYDTHYYNNVGVTKPYQLLNDANNNPIWVIEASFTFSDVGWRYVGGGEVITDYCGKRGQVDGSFVVAAANVFQLVPALRERGGRNIRFINNGCYNPVFVRWTAGGRLMVIPNDSYYDDNSGSFDVKVTVIEYLP
jgi:hypothetical protein